MLRLSTAIAVFALAMPAGAQDTSSVPAAATEDPAIAAILREGYENSQVMEHLDHLVNRIGPRLTSSDRLTQACEWAVARFQSFGLRAYKEEWGTFPVGFNRGPWAGRMTKPVERSLTFGTPAWSPGTRGKQSGVAVLAPKTMSEVKKLEGQLAGKWVLEERSRRRRGRRNRRNAAASSGGISDEVREAREALYEKEGILGIVRNTGSKLVRTSGNRKITWENLPTRVVINMAKEDWDAVATEAKAGKEPVLEFDIRNFWRRGPVPLYNVIADIKGTEMPDEYVIIGGHIDSWDGATGTTDNGTGTSTTIEAARILAAAGVKPKRTIRFMLWSGEEQGLLGSRAWVKQHQDVLPRISGVFVHDGGTNYVSGISVTPTQMADMQRIFAPVMDLNEEMPFKIREVRGLGGGGGSDHASFLAQGVPGYFWRQSGRAKYGYGWHTQNDTYDLAIPEYQRHTATIAAVAAYGVANLPTLLSREGLRSARATTPMAKRLGLQFKQGTLQVTGINAERVGAKAGIKVGDIIHAIDGLELKGDRFRLRNALEGKEKKNVIELRRGDKAVKLTVEWPAGSSR